MNVGTPDEPTVGSVKKYLREFLLDPDVIDIPAPLRHLLVRGIILNTRPKKIAPLYQKIWMQDGSPLRVYSDRVASSLRIQHEKNDTKNRKRCTRRRDVCCANCNWRSTGGFPVDLHARACAWRSTLCEEHFVGASCEKKSWGFGCRSVFYITTTTTRYYYYYYYYY